MGRRGRKKSPPINKKKGSKQMSDKVKNQTETAVAEPDSDGLTPVKLTVTDSSLRNIEELNRLFARFEKKVDTNISISLSEDDLVYYVGVLAAKVAILEEYLNANIGVTATVIERTNRIVQDNNLEDNYVKELIEKVAARVVEEMEDDKNGGT